MSTPIFKTQFGSFVYGTNVPESDTDYKSVFIPSSRDLVLQRAPRNIERNTKADSNLKNLPTDVDDESFSIQEFVKLLLEGQTVSLDIMFTPKGHWRHQSEQWNELLKVREKFLHKGTSAFVGYTKSQAAKYGVKGFRVAALRDTLEFLKGRPPDSYLHEIGMDALYRFTMETKYTELVSHTGSNGKEELYLEVCNRKIPLHAKIQYAVDSLTKIFKNYGERALLAEKNEGIDWKALMHAVRVAHEAQELLLTKNITFPRPEKDLLLKIRKGEMPYKEVEAIIEQGLHDVEQAQLKSLLPDEPDRKFADQFVYDIHLAEIGRKS